MPRRDPPQSGRRVKAAKVQNCPGIHPGNFEQIRLAVCCLEAYLVSDYVAPLAQSCSLSFFITPSIICQKLSTCKKETMKEAKTIAQARLPPSFGFPTSITFHSIGFLAEKTRKFIRLAPTFFQLVAALASWTCCQLILFQLLQIFPLKSALSFAFVSYVW